MKEIEVPKPHNEKYKSHDKEKEKEFKKINNVNDFKEYLSKEPEETNIKKPSTFIKWYILPALLIIIDLVGLVILILNRGSLGFIYSILLLVYLLFISPIILLCSAFICIRIYLDRFKISSKFMKLFKRNSIIRQIFFMPDKRIKERFVTIADDGISIKDKKEVYLLDNKHIYFDDFGIPTAFYIANLPNQVGFEFGKYLSNYFDKIKKGGYKKIKDSEGNKINVTYSAENLDKLLKDKFFKEFHEDWKPETTKIIMIILGIVALLVIAMVIIVLTIKK